MNRYEYEMMGGTEVQSYYCTNKNLNECYMYLMDITNDDVAFHDVFDRMTIPAYNGLQSGKWNWGQWMDSEDILVRGWGCSCDFTGLGGCRGGQWCCGFGGEGIGCGYTVKKDSPL